jgi:type 1 glutamine amidotransferase
VVNKGPWKTGFGAGGRGVPEWGGMVFNMDVKNGVEKKKVQSLSRAIAEGFSGLHSAMCATHCGA